MPRSRAGAGPPAPRSRGASTFGAFGGFASPRKYARAIGSRPSPPSPRRASSRNARASAGLTKPSATRRSLVPSAPPPFGALCREKAQGPAPNRGDRVIDPFPSLGLSRPPRCDAQNVPPMVATAPEALGRRSTMRRRAVSFDDLSPELLERRNSHVDATRAATPVAPETSAARYTMRM